MGPDGTGDFDLNTRGADLKRALGGGSCVWPRASHSSPFHISVFVKPNFLLGGGLGDVCRGPTEMFGQRDVFGELRPVFDRDSKPVAEGD